jgi:predicted CXXCH cytochrome family protein
MRADGGDHPARRGHRWWRWALPALVVSLIACSAGTRHRVLSFFFDGVPEPGATAAPEPTMARLMTTPGPGEDSALEREIHWTSVHEPYAQGACEACHRGEITEAVVALNDVQCLRCHSSEVRSETWDHAPAALGLCSLCHVAHVSMHPALQSQAQPALCITCHADPTLMTTVEAHRGLGEQRCTACHDPHRGAVMALGSVAR